MKKKISIVTSGHPYYDERIFYKFGRTLNKNGYEVSIICSTVESELDLIKDNIHILGFNGSNLKKSEKVNKFEEYLKIINPDIIICCEPLPILAANKIRKKNKNVKIIYDVTEWYPENVAFKFYGFKKFFTYSLLFILNIFTSNLTDAIIIGEKTKKKRYNLIAPFKRKQIISYYPVLEFFNYSIPRFDGEELILCYAGLLRFDRGINKIFHIAKNIAAKHKNTKVRLKLVGKFESSEEEKIFKINSGTSQDIEIIYSGWTEYPNISQHLSNVHLCLDLREKNFIYNNSLPIKIFEYMACGKPFIFSDIKPIKDLLESDVCGMLVNPIDTEKIIEKIEMYLNNKSLYTKHAEYGRGLIETKFNWENESTKLLDLVRSLLN